MFNSNDRDKGKPPRSLLSFGSGPDAASAGSAEALSAAERHRLARSRREAAASPLLAALAAGPANQDDAAERVARPDAPSLTSGRLERLRQRFRPDPAPAPSAPLPAAAIPGEEAGYERDDDRWRPLIDPAKLVNGIVRSRNIILATTVAGALVGVALALSTPKKYESTAEMLIDPRDLSIVGNNLTPQGLPSDATLAIVENQVRVLTSGTVMNAVVDKLKLENDPEFNGQARSFGIGAIVSELRSLLSRKDGDGGDLRRALAVRNLSRSLDVQRGGKTFVVTVSATTQEPQKSALIANTVTEAFLETYGHMQSDTAGRASDELTSRLAELQSGVEAAERKVEAYKSENDLIDAQGRLISEDEIVKLNEQLSIARARTLELNARAASARNLNLNAVVGGELPEQIASNVMAELRTQYAASKQEVERLSVRLGPRHPQRLAAEAQLAGARDSMAAELRRISSSIQVELKRAVQLEQDLSSRLAQLKARQSGVSEDLVALRELEREAAAKRAVYESYLLRARETGEQKGMNTANMSVISTAYPPIDAQGPSRAMTVLATTLLGFMAGVGIGGVRGAVDSLRGDSGPRRVPPPSPSRMAIRRENEREEIERQMQAAARRSTAPKTPVTPTPPASQSAASVPQEDAAMQPPYPYPYYPQASGQPAAPSWQEQQHAAWVAQQQHAAQLAFAAQQAQQAQYQPQPAWHAPYPQPQQYAPQAPYPHPQAAAPPQPWPPQAPQPSYNAYPQPAAWPSYPQPRPPEPPRARPQHYSAPDHTPVDDIRESLREFREAVRDLSERRARGRDY